MTNTTTIEINNTNRYINSTGIPHNRPPLYLFISVMLYIINAIVMQYSIYNILKAK